MVLYGDSHAGMWFQALNAIAIRARWRLVILFKEGCAASLSPHYQPGGGGGGDWVACNQWHRYVTKRIRQIDPALLIVSQASFYGSGNQRLQRGLRRLFTRAVSPRTAKVMIGNPTISVAGSAPDCLTRHMDDVQACSGPPDSVRSRLNNVEQRAATAGGARYINVIPWFCTKVCSDVIGHYAVYTAGDHVTVGYSFFLENVLAKALRLPTS